MTCVPRLNFDHLVQHPTWKWIRPILTAPGPMWGGLFERHQRSNSNIIIRYDISRQHRTLETWNSMNRAMARRVQKAGPVYRAGRVTAKDVATISTVTMKKYRTPQRFMHVSIPAVVWRFIAGVSGSCGPSRTFLIITVAIPLLNAIPPAERSCSSNAK